MPSRKEAREYLIKMDPILGKAIAAIMLPQDRRPKDRFYALARAIIRQQLSGKAADSIERKFIDLCGGKFPQAAEMLKIKDSLMRRAGLSRAKTEYLKNLARAVKTGEVDLEKIHRLSDDEIIEALTQVKGIGRWTAEMFLMFTLKRPDVFSYGDLGLRNAMMKLYSFRKHPPIHKAKKIVSKWSPHRTLAAMYLWATINQKKK